MTAHPDHRSPDGDLTAHVDGLADTSVGERRYTRVAVVVPAYNEAGTIVACLDSIAIAARACPLPVADHRGRR